MKIENGKIVEATDNELLDLYLRRGIDEIMSFGEYKRQICESGCVVMN